MIAWFGLSADFQTGNHHTMILPQQEYPVCRLGRRGDEAPWSFWNSCLGPLGVKNGTKHFFLSLRAVARNLAFEAKDFSCWSKRDMACLRSFCKRHSLEWKFWLPWRQEPDRAFIQARNRKRPFPVEETAVRHLRGGWAAWFISSLSVGRNRQAPQGRY